MSAKEFSNQVALVTGGAGGVGSAVVELLATGGATVFLNCFHSYPKAKELAGELTARGLDVRVLRGSVGKAEHVEKMVEEIRGTAGRLDILVNNAALGIFGTASSLTDDDLDRVFDTNVKGALRCVRAARPLLAESGEGAVVNLSSNGAGSVMDDYLAIGVTKAALEAMTRYLAVELAPDGIRVNTASGGLMDTPGGRMFPGYEDYAAMITRETPLRRLGQAEELAEVVCFLASRRARWITGQILLADGGATLPVGSYASMADRSAGPVPAAAEAVSRQEAPMREAPVREAPPETLPEDVPASSTGLDPIVVVGMGLAVPGASSPEEYWEVLNSGPRLFTEASPQRWRTTAFTPGRKDVPDKGYQHLSGLIDDLRPHPDLAAEGEQVLAGLDFNTLWLRHSLYQALEGVARTSEQRFVFCAGLTADGSQHLAENQIIASVREALHGPAGSHLTAAERAQAEQALEERFPYGRGELTSRLPQAIAADAIRGILPPGTPAHVVDTACSSSFYAIDRGVRELRAGRADVAVCGGSHAQRVSNMVLFAKLGGLSPTGEVRSLDETADGVLFSDGAGLVVLKHLSRAVADGDRILGVIEGIGLSADGKGKAINSPNTRGQVAAGRRALIAADVEPEAIDLVIAHATGTPAGDMAELVGIGEVYAADHPVTVVSNKSVTGHAAWAAGVISTIHLLLCFQHDRIPPQHRFTRLPATIAETLPTIKVPRTPIDWPSPAAAGEAGSRPRFRRGAVSGFGFGGTNAAIIVAEYAPGVAERAGVKKTGVKKGAVIDDPLVIVGWSAKEPEDGRDFGLHYPTPPIKTVSLPPPLVRNIDRSQLMALDCVGRLPEDIRRFCTEHRETTGVFVGYLGHTHNFHYGLLRVHLDDIQETLSTDGCPPGMAEFVRAFRKTVDTAMPRMNQDTYPGGMPNLIASRVSSYFDLRGLNLVVDGGEAALLRTFETAACYLETGDLDFALVAGVSANNVATWTASLRPGLVQDNSTETAEGAFLFALARESTARQAGLPVLAYLPRAAAGTETAPRTEMEMSA